MIDRKTIKEHVKKHHPEQGEDSFDDGHLGGCSIKNDYGTYYPIMWKHMVTHLGIKSVLDVGCGFGYSLDYFTDDLKLDGLGIEGSSKIIKASPLKHIIVAHDYEEGAPTIDREFDLCWSCEFVEHVQEKYLDNIFDSFKKARYLCMTFAGTRQSGHHHVNCQNGEYWAAKCYDNGFVMDIDFTQVLRQKAHEDYEAFQKCEMEDKQGFVVPHFVERGLFFKRQ